LAAVVKRGQPKSKARKEQKKRRRAEEAGDSDEDGLLRRRRVRPRTRQVYLEAIREFEDVMGVEHMKLTAESADYLMDRYIVALWKKGESVEAARFALYGLSWKLTLPTRSPLVMPLSKASLAGFGRAAPGSTKDPAPWKAILLVAWELAKTESIVNLFCSAYLLILFDMYARPSEMLAVKKSVCLPPRPSLPVPARFWAIIIAPSTGTATTKTLTQDDTVLLGSVNAGRLWLKDVLKAIHSVVATPSTCLFPLKLNTVEKLMTEFGKRAGLEALHLPPHKLRHGGPSEDMLAEVTNRFEIQARGHWGCAASVARYEKKGKLLRQIALLSDEQLRDAVTAEAWLKDQLPRLIRKRCRS